MNLSQNTDMNNNSYYNNSHSDLWIANIHI